MFNKTGLKANAIDAAKLLVILAIIIVALPFIVEILIFIALLVVYTLAYIAAVWIVCAIISVVAGGELSTS